MSLARHAIARLEHAEGAELRWDFTVRQPEPAVALRGYGGQEDEKGDGIYHGGAEAG